MAFRTPQRKKSDESGIFRVFVSVRHKLSLAPALDGGDHFRRAA
jgi:hypothetical protein